MAGAVEARADRMTTDGYDGDTAVRVRLVPQIPLRDAIQTHSRLGGRPHLPAATDWPRIDGVKGDFLAQIACADLPQGLWDGLGPRDGWLAFFAHPVTGEAIALHLAEDGPPRGGRSEEHTSELQSPMRQSYDVFCLTKQIHNHIHTDT